MMKPTETSNNFNFLERKLKLQRKFINHCIVFEVYRNVTIKHLQNTASYKNLIHCITFFKLITLHQFLCVQWFCMNSIILNLSFWIKITKSFLCLFICGHRLIYSSESSICRCSVDCFIEHSPVL